MPRTLIWRNTGKLWVPRNDFQLVEAQVVNQITDEQLERILYGSACANKQIPRLKALCEDHLAQRAKFDACWEGWAMGEFGHLNTRFGLDGFRMRCPLESAFQLYGHGPRANIDS
eukprot:g24663.t1